MKSHKHTMLGTQGSIPWLSSRFLEARRWLTQLQKPRVLILTGLTCTGKTDLSLCLAKQLDGEIISADSVQVYRGLDIGSSKINRSEMQGIAHHLIDICDPMEDYSAGKFFRAARAATEDILSRGKVPIIVGGTGFYLKWYVHGNAKTGMSTPESRQRAHEHLEQLWEKAKEKKGDELTEDEKWKVGIYALEMAGDHEAAKRIESERNNYYRLTRAVEIVLENASTMAGLAVDVQKPLDYDFRCFFLYRQRMELYERIEHRCESMITNGILEEAQKLLDYGLLPNQNCASSAIGYRQCMEFLMKLQKAEIELTDASVMDFLKDFETATRKLVKQQMTWFRGEPLYHWIDLGTESQPVNAILNKWRKLTSQRSDMTKAPLSRVEEHALRRYKPTFHEYGNKESRSQLIQRIRHIARLDSQTAVDKCIRP